MKYFLDFDRTLFDTHAFVTAVADDGRDALLSTPEIWQHYQAADFLYHDVEHFFHSKAQADCTIVTAVTEVSGKDAHGFQKAKVEQAPITSFVKDFTYVVGEKGECMRALVKNLPADEPIVFIDDKIEQCLAVKQSVPQVHCFLIVRDPAVSGAVDSVTGITIIHSLYDADVALALL